MTIRFLLRVIVSKAIHAEVGQMNDSLADVPLLPGGAARPNVVWRRRVICLLSALEGWHCHGTRRDAPLRPEVREDNAIDFLPISGIPILDLRGLLFGEYSWLLLVTMKDQKSSMVAPIGR